MTISQTGPFRLYWSCINALSTSPTRLTRLGGMLQLVLKSQHNHIRIIAMVAIF
jgi:hypothetical protein